MRLPTLLAVFATLTLFAADEPKKTETPSGDTPAKPVTGAIRALALAR